MLLKSKFNPPKVADDYHCSARLQEALMQILDFKVTAILGSPGYGKSTAIAHWVQAYFPKAVVERDSGRIGGEEVDEDDDHSSVVAWISLDKEENDTRGFWQYLAGSLFYAKAYEDESVFDAFFSDSATSLKALVTPLLNALDRPGQSTLLVIDDYDLIEREEIHETFIFFLDYLPLNVRVVMISRVRPLINVARRRMLDEYLELLPEHFRLDLGQVVSLFNSTLKRNRLSLPARGVERRLCESSGAAQLVFRLSQGWPVGVKLLALSTRISAEVELDVQANSSDQTQQIEPGHIQCSVADGELMSDYFLGEVVSKLPEQLIQFLYHTAHLPRLTVSLCEACLSYHSGSDPVSDEEQNISHDERCDLVEPVDVKLALDHLAREGLFLESVDLHRQTYKYHGLFQRFLRVQAERKISDKIPLLRARTAKWFYRSGDIELALEQVLQIQDWPWAVSLLEELGSQLINEGRYQTLKSSMQHLPAAFIEDHPRLMLFLMRVWICEATTHINPMRRYMSRVDELLSEWQNRHEQDGGCEERGVCAFGIKSLKEWYQAKGEQGFIGSYWARLQGEVSQSELISRDSLKLAEDEGLPLRAPAYFSVGMSYYLRGDLKAGAEAVEQAWRFGKIESNFEIVSGAAVRLAWVYQWQGQFKAAIEIYQRTRSWLESKGCCPDIFICWQNLMLVAYYRELNQLDKATDCLNTVRRMMGGDPKLALFVPFVEARLEESKRHFVIADQLLEEVERLYRPLAATVQGFPSVDAARAKLALVSGNHVLAFDWLERMEEARDGAGNPVLDSGRYRYEEVRLTAARVLIVQAQASEDKSSWQESVQLAKRNRLSENPLEAAISLLNQVEKCALSGNRVSNFITSKILLAVAELSRKESLEVHCELALAHYRLALGIGARDGYIRLFVEEFPEQQQQLLLRIHQSEPSFEYAERLRALLQESRENDAFEAVVDVNASPSAVANRRLNGSPFNYGETLSRREMDVLRLLGQGLANKAIADTLFVGVGTVKTHVRNILSKFSVSNRTQAVVRAREFGMIE